MISGAQQITDPYIVEILKIAHMHNVEVDIDHEKHTVNFKTEDEDKIESIAIAIELLNIG